MGAVGGGVDRGAPPVAGSHWEAFAASQSSEPANRREAGRWGRPGEGRGGVRYLGHHLSVTRLDSGPG